MFVIFDESVEDERKINALLDIAFGPTRCDLSAYRLRDGIEPVSKLCIIARDSQGLLVGSLRFWPVCVGDLDVPVLLLGPVAVHPTCQGEGLGSSLISEGLLRSRMDGWNHVLLIGDPPYYRRFGFTRCQSVVMPPPTDPERVLQICHFGNASELSGKVRRWTQPITV